MNNTVAFAGDHAGVALKHALIAEAEMLGFTTLNLGTNTDASVDYPDFGDALAVAITTGKARFGVAICGSGVGISIAANRHAGVRAALCRDAETAMLSRAHNDANVLALGARLTGIDEAKECLRVFLQTPFEGGRHETRVKKLG